MSDNISDVRGRRRALRWLVLTTSASFLPSTVRRAMAADDEAAQRFAFLSENGNSTCSAKFLQSIPSMNDSARLQGSCCGPMALHRYREQIEGLKAYSSIAIVPPDPYDVEVRLAKRLLVAYEFKLPPEHQTFYDEAMNLSDEGGPCCCQCWRWHVFGGLGKLLVSAHGFDGAKLARVWNLSGGCGGDSHVH
jgi:hypothetical protein